MKQLQDAVATPKLYIGLDIHKKTWSVFFKTDICSHKGFSMPSEFEILEQYVQNNFPNHEVHLVYEAGCCGFSVARKGLYLGWNVVVVNPADIPTADKHQYQKNDKIDAKQLCDLLKLGLLKSVYIPTEEKEQFNLLLRQRNSITKELRFVKNRIKSNLLYLGIKIPEELDKPTWSKAFLQWLSDLKFSYSTGQLMMKSMLDVYHILYKQYLELANELRKYARTHHKQDYYLLKSVPGVGGYIASAILADLGDIRRFKNEREFSSYVGMVPGVHQSAGKDAPMGITPRCRALIRTYLVESAWVALRLDPELQQYYRKHVGKNVKSVIIKIAHKLLKRIYSVVKNNKLYQNNYTMESDKNIIELAKKNEKQLELQEEDMATS